MARSGQVYTSLSCAPILNSEGEITGAMATHKDITDWRSAEEALRASEDRYRRIVETASEGIWVCDIDVRTVFVNKRMAEMLGYTPEEMIGKIAYEFMDDEAAILAKRYNAERRQKVLINSYEQRYLRKDGAVLWAIVSASPLTNNQGQINGFMTAITDITERKRTEEAVQVMMERFYKILSNMRAAVLLVTLDNRIEYANQAFCDYFDLKESPEELVGLNASEMIGKIKDRYVNPDDAVARIKLIVDQQQPVIGEEVTMQAGRTCLRDYIPLTIYGEKSGRLWIHVDITERKQAEDAFQESEENYRELVGNANSIILRSDWEGNITYFNEFAERFFGYSREEVVGRKAIGTIIPESDSSGRDLVAMLDDLLRRPEEYRTNAHQNICKDGRLVWISWTNKAIYNENGDLAELLCIGTDISQLKHAEESLLEAKQQAELYLDLMGHDINNMHQIALSYLELALGTPPGVQHDEMIEKPVEVLRRSAQLIRNVQKLQMHADGTLQARSVDLVGVLMDVQQEFGVAPGKTVTLHNGCGHCYVLANELLHDVFANLVGNAIKHTGERADIHIILDMVNDNGRRYYRVNVEDDGPGIPDDFKILVFNRLLKGANKAKGMGLGLYLVESLVDSYGGRVWVEDRVSGDHTKGAKFVVILPAIKD